MHKKVAMVTGANRGMGFETSRQLARLGYKVILTARDEIKGNTATQLLKREDLDVEFMQLDVADPQNIHALADTLKQQGIKIYALVNNAGVLSEPMDPNDTSVFNANPDIIVSSFKTNTLGPLLLVNALRPIMSDDARIVNVSSGMGQLSDMNGGWPAYRLSKVALNAVTRMLADELKGSAIKVNSVCPGWVRTDMGGDNADRSVEHGVETTVWLATLPHDGPSGGFFRDKAVIPW